MNEESSRYELVSRRAMLKKSAGVGLAIVLPVACGNSDATVFAGAATDPVDGAIPTTAPVVPPTAESAAAQAVEPTPQPLPEPTAVPPEPTAVSAEDEALDAPTPPPTEDPLAEPTAVPAPDPTADPTAEPAPTAAPAPAIAAAVAGEMIISFTYTQGAGGKNERPYIAVWIEDAAGELATTVSLWYQQVRRGARWLDHLDRWWAVDQSRQAQGGVDNIAAVSSATRQAGSYTIAWDGAVDGAPAAPGSYFVCIEAAREEGPYSLIREPVTLTGTLPDTPLPDNGELSAARIRIDV